MPCSWIGRHSLGSEFWLYWLYSCHSFLVPVALLATTLQVLRLAGHARTGRAFFQYVFFPVVLTGLLLTISSRGDHLVPTNLVFCSYGLSYYLVGTAVENPRSNLLASPCYVAAVRACQAMHLVCAYVLATTPGEVSSELLLLLLPVPVLHGFLLKHRDHATQAYVFYYLGCIGTAFTVAHDRYWLFSTQLPYAQRITVESVPLLGLCIALSQTRIRCQYRPFSAFCTCASF